MEPEASLSLIDKVEQLGSDTYKHQGSSPVHKAPKLIALLSLC